MTARSVLLATLLSLGILLVGLPGVFSAQATLPPDRSHQTAPPPMLDSFESLGREAVAKLFSKGCLAVTVMALVDREGRIHLFVRCDEWRETQPTSR